MAVAHVGSTRTLRAGSRHSPWVDGVGVAGVVWTRGTTTLGSAAAAWAGSSARSGLRLAVLLVVAIGDSASASISGSTSLCLWSSTSSLLPAAA